jgi:hypothetical protein
VAIQSSIGFCFFWPRVCWLLFSSSIEVVNTCLDYCLDLLLNWLSAPPLGSRPSPADPYPSCLPTPHRFGWSAAHPVGLGLPTPHCPIGRVSPPRLALGLPTPQRASPVGPPFDGTQPTGSGALVTHRQWAKPLCLGRPTDWVGRVEEGREDPGRGFDFEEL